ncbi:MAG: hypothetical protein BIFFINMI_00042 [Phycisphaerae bacterium]|nr:hypothetical protein [Phycisphaerae bacterium]
MPAFERRLTQDVTIHDSARSLSGYTLFSPTFGRNCWIVDMAGRVCHYWTLPTPPASQGKLLRSGNLMWQGKGPGSNVDFVGSGTELVEYDWDGREVWRFDQPGLNHDFIELPDGHFIVNVYVEIPPERAARIRGGIPGSELRGKVWTCQLREIDRGGNVLWSWTAADDLDIETDDICPLCPRHCWGFVNGMDLLPDGDLLVCLRLLNDLAIVDRKAGRIRWRLGRDRELGHPHFPTHTGDGRVMVFDNGLHRRGANPHLQIADIAASRVVEFDVAARQPVWQYMDPLAPRFFSAICSSAQRLGNGNTLICEATKGHFIEVSPDGAIVWEYWSPFVITRPNYWGWTKALTVWAAHRYAADDSRLAGRDLDPGRFEWDIRARKSASAAKQEKQ